MITIFLLISVAARAEFRIESLDHDFVAEVADASAENKSLVIMFDQTGCPYCDKMRRRVIRNPAVDSYYSHHFVMVENNIRGALEVVSPDGKAMTQKELARRLRIRATPVFLYLDKDGKEALRLTGFLDADLFVKAGEYVTNGVYKTGTSFYRYLQAK